MRSRLTALYLIPTLYHDLIHSPEFRPERAASVKKLAYAGAPMLAALTERCVKAFRPDVFVNHYGSTEIYTFSVFPGVDAKPGCAGRAGLYSTLRIVTASTERGVGPDETVAAGDKGEVIARRERVAAFVVPGAAGLTAEALDRHCLDSPDLASFKRPRRIVFVGEIPKTASSKILRRPLRDGTTETRRHE